MKKVSIAIAVSAAAIVVGFQWRLPNMNIIGEGPVRNRVIESVRGYAGALEIAVDSGKAWGYRLRLDAQSGKLLFFSRWP